MDLEDESLRLAPKAVEWTEQQEAHALEVGSPLFYTLTDVARSIGVMAPEFIRIMVVDRLPMPIDPEMRVAENDTGALGSSILGDLI